MHMLNKMSTGRDQQAFVFVLTEVLTMHSWPTFMQLRLVLNWHSSCLCFPSAGVTDVCHHYQLRAELCALLSSTFLLDNHLESKLLPYDFVTFLVYSS